MKMKDVTVGKQYTTRSLGVVTVLDKSKSVSRPHARLIKVSPKLGNVRYIPPSYLIQEVSQ